MNIQPKPFLEKIRLRKQAKGNERRRNMEKLILDHRPNFPLSIEFEDIDKAFEKWIKDLNISFEGKILPIFKLFSNQRIGEYSQSWKHLDEIGNLLLNFFAITRDNNPKQGQNQGGSFNIPGNRNYPMFIVPTLQENGEEAWDMYSMKQPYCVDFSYSLTLITNKYELLNKVNSTIINEFKALECYIAPNNHYMPMKLEDISDESEYTIDDRKYYSQTFKISLWGYIIRKEDYTVTKLPSRFVGRMLGVETSIKNKKTVDVDIEEIEDFNDPLSCCNTRDEEPNRYSKKQVKLTVNFPTCEYKTEFEMDTVIHVTDIQTKNIYDFVMTINNEYVNFDEDVDIYSGDIISFEIERDKIIDVSSITIIGESDEVIDEIKDYESILDEPISEEDITYNA